MAALLSEQRAEANEILRASGVEASLAPQLLVEALLSVESPFGMVPSASSQWLKTLRTSCRRSKASVLPAVTDQDRYDNAFLLAGDRLTEIRHRRVEEQTTARQLLRELEYSLADPTGPDLPRRFNSAGFVALLLRTIKGCWSDNPKRAENLVAWAVRLVQELDPETYGVTRVLDLKAQAHTYQGNVSRILGNFRAADVSFAEADRLLAQGSKDPRARAELLGFLASLRRLQSRFDDAHRLLAQAAAIHRWLQDRHGEGRILLYKAMTLSYADDPEGAIPVVERALELIDGEREPRLLLVAYHNLATYLRDCELIPQLLELLPKVQRLAEDHGGALDLLRLYWLEGMALITIGESRRGEELLRRARNGFIAEDIGYEAALVCLDIVALYLQEGRGREARHLASEMLPLLGLSGLHDDATMALLMLQRALEMETATLRWVQEIQARMSRLPSGPAAPSRTPS